MPRKRKGAREGGYAKRAAQPRGDPLSVDERAVLRTLAPSAQPRASARAAIRATAPFAGPELRAAAIEKLARERGTEIGTTIAVRLPLAIYLRVKELSEIQEITLAECAGNLLFRGLSNTGLTLDRKKVEDAVRAFMRAVLEDDKPIQRDDDDPFASIEGTRLGKGLAAEIKRSRKG